MIPFFTMGTDKRVLFILVSLFIIFFCALFLRQQREKSWIMTMPSPIATSAAFPMELGGLTVLNKSIYLSLENGMFHRISHNGNTLWSFAMQNYTIFPAVEDEHLTFITSFDGRLYALETETGEEVWRFTTPDYINADTEPLVDGSTVYFGSRNGALYALDKKTGETRWNFQTTPIDSSRYNPSQPIIHFGRLAIDEKSIYVNSATDNALYALNKTDGSIRWKLSHYGFVYQKPIITDDTVSIQNNNGITLTLNKENGYVLQTGPAARATPSSLLQFDNPQIDALQLRSHGDVLYALTKNKTRLIKLTNDTKVENIKLETIPKKRLLIPKHKAKKSNPQDISIMPQETMRQNEVYTLTVTHDDTAYANPFDAGFHAEFTSPSNVTYNVSAFYFDKNTWHIRFRPQETGQWTWKVKSEGKELSQGNAQAQPSDKSDFLTLSSNNPQVFFHKQQPVFPLGLQDCFRDYNHDGSPLDQWFPGVGLQPPTHQEVRAHSMQEYLRLYKKGGFNLWRYGVGNCAKTLWFEMSPAGNRYNINEAYYVDKLFESLHDYDYHIFMSLLSFTLPFDLTNTSNSDQKTILQKYLDYMVARYGAYVDVWELANEIHLSDDIIAFMSSYIRSVDPYKHPIATNWERPDHPAIEINSLHWYDAECDLYCVRNVETQINKITSLQKPTIFSEIGNRDANWDPRSADRMRARLWVGYFYDISPIYWNTSDSYYSSVHGASNIFLGPTERSYTKIFSDTIASMQGGERIKIVTQTEGVIALGKKSATHTLIYLHRNINAPAKSPAAIELPDASIRSLEWIDPKTGITHRASKPNPASTTIVTPPFTTDLLLKISYN
jgi:outer membrane protein assembly factor BamB